MDYRDFEVFMVAYQQKDAGCKLFLFRTAASFHKVAARLQDRPLLERVEVIDDRASDGGSIVFDFYVPQSTSQLDVLLVMGVMEAFGLGPKFLKQG